MRAIKIISLSAFVVTTIVFMEVFKVKPFWYEHPILVAIIWFSALIIWAIVETNTD